MWYEMWHSFLRLPKVHHPTFYCPKFALSVCRPLWVSRFTTCFTWCPRLSVFVFRCGMECGIRFCACLKCIVPRFIARSLLALSVCRPVWVLVFTTCFTCCLSMFVLGYDMECGIRFCASLKCIIPRFIARSLFALSICRPLWMYVVFTACFTCCLSMSASHGWLGPNTLKIQKNAIC